MVFLKVQSNVELKGKPLLARWPDNMCVNCQIKGFSTHLDIMKLPIHLSVTPVEACCSLCRRRAVAGDGRQNASAPEGFILEGFILVGFSDRPQLELALFVAALAFYLLTLLGNAAIVLLSALDSRLHTPMYFFLANLSFLDVCFTTGSVPQMLYNLRGPDKTISYVGCAVQLFFVLALGGVECVLLAVMAYDRYAAVCRPLHYTLIMHPRLCGQLASAAWLSGFGNSLVMAPQTLLLPRCGHRRVDHFLCEMPALIGMACVDTTTLEALAFALAIFIILAPLGLILTSYGHIARAVLRIRSAAGRRKALNTCSAHLAVVSLFYGTIIYMYLQPANAYSQDQGKFLTLFYTIVTPSVNPLIYTLRNKDVREAVKKVLGKGRAPVQ